MVRKIRLTIFSLLIMLVMAMFVPTVDAYSIVAWGDDGGGQVSNTPSGNDFVDIAGGEYHNLALEGPIPEPATIVLMGFGLLGLVGVVIKQRRKGK